MATMKGMLQVTILKATNLKKADTFGKSDPYVVASVSTQSKQTKVIKSNLNPTWNETFVFYPTVANQGGFLLTDLSLAVQCFDYDSIGEHDELGSGLVDLHDVPFREKVRRVVSMAEKGELYVELFAEDFGVGCKAPPAYAPEVDSVESTHRSDIPEIITFAPKDDPLPEKRGRGPNFLKSFPQFNDPYRLSEPNSLVVPAAAEIQRGSTVNALASEIDGLRREIALLTEVQAQGHVRRPPSQVVQVDDSKDSVGTLQATVEKAFLQNHEVNPFARLKVGNKKIETTVKRQTCNPVWKEAFRFFVPLQPGSFGHRESILPLAVSVLHKGPDEVDGEIASASIPLQDLFEKRPMEVTAVLEDSHGVEQGRIVLVLRALNFGWKAVDQSDKTASEPSFVTEVPREFPQPGETATTEAVFVTVGREEPTTSTQVVDPDVAALSLELHRLQSESIELDRARENQRIPLQLELEALKTQVHRVHTQLERLRSLEGDLCLDTFGEPGRTRSHQDRLPLSR
eukprot:NODE_205_length_2768_cov_58.839647_g188_i0.p1 GENE.NODE_205_length_2768_cov_58.839647_g188_i0~~NODE_205_length_2768_cov_58.839647_g188_i0.p1  ORF type:complete len:514 (+),score=66.15 NODE_205_length_2768_cov_58.839647_g188_i0:1161-2702(+)